MKAKLVRNGDVALHICRASTRLWLVTLLAVVANTSGYTNSSKVQVVIRSRSCDSWTLLELLKLDIFAADERAIESSLQILERMGFPSEYQA